MEFNIKVPSNFPPERTYPYLAHGNADTCYVNDLYYVISRGKGYQIGNCKLLDLSETNLEELPDGAVIVVKNKKGG